MDVSFHHNEQLIRPWRTAAFVAAAVAAVELLVLVVVGGALIAKASTGASAKPAHEGRRHEDRNGQDRSASRRGEAATGGGSGRAASRARRVSVVVLNGNGRQGAAAATAARASRARLPHRRCRECAQLGLHAHPRDVPQGLRGRRPTARARSRDRDRRPARRPPHRAAPRLARRRRHRRLDDASPAAGRIRRVVDRIARAIQFAAHVEEAALRIERVGGVEREVRAAEVSRRCTGTARARTT